MDNRVQAHLLFRQNYSGGETSAAIDYKSTFRKLVGI
jgi:hypothetical protein